MEQHIMNTKTTVRAVSTLVIATLLTGFAATSAEAATPTTPSASTAQTLTSTTPVAPTPQYSKRFDFRNKLGSDMTLFSASGDNEGLPPLGITMTIDESHAFQVHYRAFGTGTVDATYDVYGWKGAYLGRVSIRMTYGAFGETNTVLTGSWGSLANKVILVGKGTDVD